MSKPCFCSFEDFTRKLMEEHHIVGAAVNVKKGADTIYEGCFGVRDMSSGAAVTPDTIFGIASVSKSFTAMATMQLCDAGKVYPDAPVVKYLPEFSMRGTSNMEGVKVHHLLSHTTGLPPFKRRQGEFSDLSQHLEYIGSADYELLGKPGEFFSYCNDSFIMLGAVIERVTGQKFRDYMREHLFEPIGMSRSSHSPVGLDAYGNDVTTLYNYNYQTGKHEPQRWPDLGTYHVSGGIRSTIRDLSAYASVYTQGGKANGNRIVSDHAIRRMRQPVIEVSRNGYYCYGLQSVLGYEGVTLVSHGGSLPGVSSHFGYIPEKHISVSVLTNVNGVPAKSIWMAAVNAALGLPVEQEASVEPSWLAPRSYLERYVGKYSSSEGGNLNIYFDGDELTAEMRGETMALQASDKYRLTGQIHGQQQILRFFSHEDDSVWAVLAGSRMLRKERV